MLTRILNERVSAVLWACCGVAYTLASLAALVGGSTLNWQAVIGLFCLCGLAVLPAVAFLRGDRFGVWVVRVEAALVLVFLTWWVWHRHGFIDLGTLLAIGASVWVVLGLFYRHHDQTS